jgi:hypothetical protein
MALVIGVVGGYTNYLVAEQHEEQLFGKNGKIEHKLSKRYITLTTGAPTILTSTDCKLGCLFEINATYQSKIKQTAVT